MKRLDAMVLGAGIVGASAALALARRGMQVALVDRQPPGLETSYGNAGIVEGNAIFPHAFPKGLRKLLRVALKQATEANYHLSALLRVAPWLLAFKERSQPHVLEEMATIMRPMFALAVSEHEALAADAGVPALIARRGWLRVYRTDKGLAGNTHERDIAAQLGIAVRVLDGDEARALEPALSAVVRHAVLWEEAAFVDDPLALTRAYVARLEALGGRLVTADARTLAPSDGGWRVDADEGPVMADHAVVALGPWAPDVLAPLGLRLPLAVKRGYHLHYEPAGRARLTRPLLDAEVGYCLAPMAQGIRLTTGAEFAARDARPTPVQIDRVLPYAKELVSLGRQVEAKPWMGSRPCFPDSRPVIGRAPQKGLWLAVGHGHLGLTTAAISARLLADLMMGTPPMIDPAPFGVARFLK
jgi:D-amino-acid dehydrogenase